MGRLAIPVNIIALIYIAFAMVMSFFPIFAVVTPANMNWSILVYAVIVIFAVVVYVLQGRKVYRGPVVHVKQWDSVS